MRHYNIPVFVPHKGCPHDCSFCNQKRITGRQTEQSLEEIRSEIETHLETFEKNSHIEIAFFGGSFTGIEENKQIELLALASEYIKSGKVNGIRLSTRPDYINVHILEYLKSFGVTAIELGVQTLDDHILKLNNRGHSSADVENAVHLIKSYNQFELGLQQMTGLWGATPESDFSTAEKIVSLKPDTVRIYPTVVLEGTQLYELYKQGLYTPYSLETSVETGSRLYELYTSAGIRVIRMGLQATEVINERDEKIYGPYHSSYGELVKSRLIRNQLETMLTDKKGVVEITANPRLISKIIGNKKGNLTYFKENFDITLKVKADTNENFMSVNVIEK